MELSGLVLRDGVVARASGRVLAIDGTVWFERPLPQTAVLIFPPRAPRPSRYAVRVHGVDLDRLDRRTSYDEGVVEGWATLTGTWRRRELRVSAQTAAAERATWADRWTSPPCAEPATGWPPLAEYGNLPVRAPDHDECRELTITAITLFRPPESRGVYVVAAEEPERAERALRPRLGTALCVVRSRYRRAEIDHTLRRLRTEARARDWLLTSSGETTGADGQPAVTAEFAWLEPEFAEWAGSVPPGLLDLHVWLTPDDTRPATAG